MNDDPLPNSTHPVNPHAALDPAESEALLTVQDVSERLGVDPRTVRRYCKQGKLAARKVSEAGKPDSWRIHPKAADTLSAELAKDKTRTGRASVSGRTGLIDVDSLLRTVREAVRAEFADQQRALPEPEEEHQKRAEREQRIEEALGGNMARIEELAEENGRLQAESQQLRAENDQLRKKVARLTELLEAERRKTWWQRLAGK